MKNYVEYSPDRKEVIIYNISIERLKNRIHETFSSNNIQAINGSKYLALFNKMEYITWLETRMSFYSFFALEVYELFCTLATEYHDTKYADVAGQLFERTWIRNYKERDKAKIDTLPLMKLNYKLKDYQLEFIENYPKLKFMYDLNGYILSFEQGLGKTLTAIALGECLKKDVFYIVCPNSIKEVWANEIKKYYREYNENEQQWKKDVYVSGINNPNKNAKFYIVNQESIPNIFQFIDKSKDSIIIVDECHNFRNNDAKRVNSLYELKQLTNAQDILLMSGTPIKATANEIIPALRMIDPHFTEGLAKLYNKTFSSTSTESANIAKARFRRVIYRKLKKDVELKLPEKYRTDLLYSIPNPQRYGVGKVKKEIMDVFHKEYINRLQNGLFTTNKTSPFYRSTAPGYNFLDEKIKFENIIRKYSRAKTSIIDDYLNKIFQSREDNLDYTLINHFNIDAQYFSFLNKYVVPYVPKEKKEYVTTRFNGIFGWAIAAKSATGYAIGKVFAKYKSECFIEIWKYNEREFIDLILKAEKKTVIFSNMIPVIDYIYERLEKNNIECVKVTGTDSGRMNLINEFKTNSKIQVLCATTQTLSTGITLNEANQILFFGTPYRESDIRQAEDRIHRIGQNKSCFVYNILLKSQDKNITGRIQEIVNWSGDIFDSLLNENYT